MPSAKDHVVAAIFDGHGGSSTAHYAAENMVKVIENTESWKKYLESKFIGDLSAALVDAFLTIDRNMYCETRLIQANISTHFLLFSVVGTALI